MKYRLENESVDKLSAALARGDKRTMRQTGLEDLYTDSIEETLYGNSSSETGEEQD